MKPREYESRIRQALGGRSSLKLKWKNTEEARLHLQNLNRTKNELRLLLKELNEDIKEVRAGGQKRLKNAGRGLDVDMMGLLFGKEASHKLRAKRQESKRVNLVHELTPYEALHERLEGLVSELEELKDQLNDWLKHNAG